MKVEGKSNLVLNLTLNRIDWGKDVGHGGYDSPSQLLGPAAV